MTITATCTSAVATLPSELLRSESERFLRKVINDFSESFPALRSNAFVASIPLEIAAAGD